MRKAGQRNGGLGVLLLAVTERACALSTRDDTIIGGAVRAKLFSSAGRISAG